MIDDPDAGLMLRVARGDEGAFRELYRRHGPNVLRFAARFLGSVTQAEDVVQETFLQVFRARRRYQATARFSTWLFTIAANICRNRATRERLVLGAAGDVAAQEREAGLHEALPVSPEEEAAVRQLERRLGRLIAELPEKQRAALILSRLDGLSYRDVGRVLGCSEGAVKALLFRACHRLREALEASRGECASAGG